MPIVPAQSTNPMQAIQQDLRATKHRLEQAEAFIAEIGKMVVVKKGETATGHEIVARLRHMAAAFVDRSMRLEQMTAAVRAAVASTPCDIDAAGTCHAHGIMGPCPVGALALLLPPTKQQVQS